MVSSRKTRILAVSAALLTLVFIFMTAQNNKVSNIIPHSTKDSTSRTQHKAEITKVEVIDKSAIKKNEEKLKEENKDAENALKSNQEIKSEQFKDTGSADGIFDAEQDFQFILGLSPVVIFSKTYCGFSAALKSLLKSEYEIYPPPTIIELDKHKNGKELQEYISAKSGRSTVPNLFVNGISRGGCSEMKQLHAEGRLSDNLNSWGDKNIRVTKVTAQSNS